MFKKKQNDIIYKLISSSKNRLSIFRKIPANNQGFILLTLSKKFQREIIGKLKNNEISKFITYLDPDETANLLQNMDFSRRKKIIKTLTRSIKEKVEFLLRFNPKTAAGMMSLNYIEVNKNISFEEVLEATQKHEKVTGKFPAMFAVENGFLVGELPAHTMLSVRKNEKIGKYLKKVLHIRYDQDENEVINTFKKHPHNKVVVLDESDSIMGVIYSDDVLRLSEKGSGRSLRGFAGVREEEHVFDSMFTKVRNRYKWLILNLGTAFLAAGVVSLFQETISAFILLAIYMPIIAGMGGNAGTQTLAVVVRGIALKEIDLKTGKKVILNETLAGGVNGLINGILVAVIAVLLNKTPLFGLIVGLAMVINLVIAGMFGTLIPLIMKRLGKDPASSATIFITTTTDVFGFFVFLGLATIIL
ncbi:MAG: magnesium transporter [Candidatus Aenigmarchaeota archaeon]|nr:magnesium transporter [Candidatus Aenigmarchaeota archaeon]